MECFKKNWKNWKLEDSRVINHLKSSNTMRYDISKASTPAMPTLEKGTECIKILLSQVSKVVREPLVPMIFPLYVHKWVLQKISSLNAFGGFFVAQ